MTYFERVAFLVGVIVLLCAAKDLSAQTQGSAVRKAGGSAASTATPVTSLMISDVHFDPFRDPSKAERLMNSSEGEWSKILGEENAPDQKEAFARIQKTCHETAEDSPYALMQSALTAMKDKAPDARFALLSGDLLVHSLECRFKTLLPGRSESDYKAFAEKTARYTIDQVRLGLTGVPLYVALGNNDNTCRDYALDVDDPFLTAMRESVMGWLPAGPQKSMALASFSHMGDYSILMEAPMQHTRLIVLDDLFQSRKYTNCAGKPDDAAVASQIAWLDKELAGAKQRGERVWVMGHIPMGIDSFATLMQGKKVCSGELPVMFLSNERLADVMGKYADVIKLGVFGHSHMDEIRLFGTARDDGEGTGAKGKVAIKMVSAITPLAAGVPEFTVAKVDVDAARLVDYTVYSASNSSGVNAVWTKVYSYGETYQKTEFSPVALNELIEGFEADPEATSSASGAYLRSVVGGEKALMLKAFWPEYTCAMEHHTAKGFAACFCPSK